MKNIKLLCKKQGAYFKNVFDMANSPQLIEIELLKHQVELEESNYKYAVELKKDYSTLRRMRENIRELRDVLEEKIKNADLAIIESSNSIYRSNVEPA